jgi:hypothetical protein
LDFVSAARIKVREGDVRILANMEYAPCTKAQLQDYWPISAKAGSTLNGVPNGAVVVYTEDKGGVVFPPGSQSLKVPESGKVSYTYPDGRKISLDGKPGEYIVVVAAGYHYHYPATAQIQTVNVQNDSSNSAPAGPSPSAAKPK